MQHCRCTSSSLWFVALAVLVGITAVAPNADAQVSYQVVAAFDRPNSSGANPSGGLIQGTDGSFYGTTSNGGAAGFGAIFKIDASGTLTALHSFNGADGGYPFGGLTQGSDGSFYGTTYSGGAYGGSGYGTIFKVDAAGTLTTLHRFTYGVDGACPSDWLVKGSDDSMYGTTSYGGAAGYGTVFKIDATGTLTTFHSFDYASGGSPFGGLIQGRDGSFYGTTSSGAPGYGTIFRIDAAGTLTTLHFFNGADGAAPSGRLTQGSNGSFYGTTSQGGAVAPGYGTVFKIDLAGTLTTSHSFNGVDGAQPRGGLFQADDGSFYGTTGSGGAAGSGTIFRIDAAGTLTTLHNFNYTNGGFPSGGIIQGDDRAFYGTTYQGGELGSGTIFKIDSAGTLTSLHTFGAREPRNPQAGLIQAGDGSFLGTTSEGGAANRGTVFKMDAAGALTILHGFATGEGANPQSRLMQASDGSSYGTTPYGAPGYGTIFKVDAAGRLTTLHSFSYSDGANPSGGLIEASDGSFYGTTSYGGPMGYGTVFKIDAAGTLTTLHQFIYSDGSYPSGGVIQGSDASLYGETSSGGTIGCGTVFKIDPAGTLTTLYSFDCVNGGSNPSGGVIQGSDGSFYGSTQYGGVGYGGTIFKIDAAGTLTTLHSFNWSDGAYPVGTLIQASDASFYGTTQTGGSVGVGTIFKIDATGIVTTLHLFSESDGASPAGGLIQGSDGSFYGTTSRGGAGGSGVVFRLTVQMPTITALTVSPTTSMFGQSVALTAIVTTAGFTPTGSVAFFDGLTALGTGALSGGTATLRTSTLSTGSHAVRVEYAGVSAFAPSVSSVVTHVVVLPATFINPANHATNVDLTQPFTWTSVAGAQAYYLYVGTSVGAKDLVNTGEIQLTSYRVPLTLATGATLYARLWTKVGGTWRFVDAAFSAPPIARFTYPADAATNVDLTQPFTWTSVSGAQAYYLYVGTSAGAKDLVNTSEIQVTSYRVPLTLATGTTLYARLWTKVAGTWRFVDRTFSAPPIARFTYPAAGTTSVDPTQLLTWTAVPAVQAYYLYVGSTAGAKDLVNSFEIQQTSYRIPLTVATGNTLYARLWTKAGGVWRFVDRTFSVPPIARFWYPAAGATSIGAGEYLTWTAIPAAQAYYLYVGSTAGAKDLLNTGEIQQTSYHLPSSVPADQILYVRLWTKVGDVWRYVDTTFRLFRL